MDQYIRSQLLSAVNNNDNDKIIETYQKIKSEGGLIIILYSWYACFSYLVLLRIRYNVMIMYVDYIAVKGGFITGGGVKDAQFQILKMYRSRFVVQFSP